jgi:hypothetical protein
VNYPRRRNRNSRYIDVEFRSSYFFFLLDLLEVARSEHLNTPQPQPTIRFRHTGEEVFFVCLFWGFLVSKNNLRWIVFTGADPHGKILDLCLSPIQEVFTGKGVHFYISIFFFSFKMLYFYLIFVTTTMKIL